MVLKILNQKRGSWPRCTEDQFEEVMNFFEETAQAKQPYAAVDNPPVVPYEEMEEGFDTAIDDEAKYFAKDIYEHWKSRRTTAGNRPLAPGLKVRYPLSGQFPWDEELTQRAQSETGRDTDDGDPYVCFRRREVRQVRKTRGRDLQSADKLRRLRKEMEDARQLIGMVRQREFVRKEMLASDRQVFTQRAEVKEMKRKLGIKDDDEDLINQKVRNNSSRAVSVHQTLTVVLAKEETCRASSRPASSSSPAPNTSTRNRPTWRRLDPSGRRAGGQGERDRG